MSSALKSLILAAVASTLAGCGARPVTGGTKGVLLYAGKSLSDIQVTVYQLEGASPKLVGFGVTANDGSFHLMRNLARGALWLSPGEYCCTLESVGVPIRLPKEYARAETTPLKVSWSKADQSLNLEVPSPSSVASAG